MCTSIYVDCGERKFNLYLYVYIMYIFIHTLTYANNCAIQLELGC